jgi:hypothetical protein
LCVPVFLASNNDAAEFAEDAPRRAVDASDSDSNYSSPPSALPATGRASAGQQCGGVSAVECTNVLLYYLSFYYLNLMYCRHSTLGTILRWSRDSRARAPDRTRAPDSPSDSRPDSHLMLVNCNLLSYLCTVVVSTTLYLLYTHTTNRFALALMVSLQHAWHLQIGQVSKWPCLPYRLSSANASFDHFSPLSGAIRGTRTSICHGRAPI